MLFALPLHAQHVIRGQVLGEGQKPLAGASVTGHTLPDSSLKVFAITDGNGQFSLNTTDSTLVLRVRLLHYAQHQHRWRPGQPQLLVFTLTPKLTVLQEVTVKDLAPPVVEKHDTTVFNVKSFSDGTERNLETLIRKMPGFEVDAQGRITYQKKPIPEVRLNGADVFARNYQLLTRTIAPAAIKSIEVIENFSDFPLLSGIEKSGQTILNLVVADDKRGRPFGSVRAQGGSFGRYDGTASVFSVFNAVKLGVVAKANNIGQPIISPQSELRGEDLSIPSFFRSPEFRITTLRYGATLPPLPTERTLFNESRTASMSLTVPAGRRLSLHGSGLLSRDRYRWRQFYNTTNLVNEQVSYGERGQLTQTPRQGSSLLRADARLGAKVSLRTEYAYRREAFSQQDSLRVLNELLTERILSQTDARQQQHTLDNRLIYRLGPRSALDVIVGFTQKSLQQNDRFHSQRYAETLGRPADGLQQGLHQQATTYRTGVFVPLRRGNYYARVGGGYAHETERLGSGLGRLLGPTATPLPGAPFSNAFRQEKNLLKIGGELAYLPLQPTTNGVATPNMQKWNTRVAGWLSRYTVRQHDPLRGVDQTRTGLLADANAMLSYRERRRPSVSLTYNLSEDLPPLLQQAAGLLLTDYRSTQRGVPVLQKSRRQFLNLSVRHSNLSTYYNLSATASLLRNRPGYLAVFSISDLLSGSEWRPFGGSTSGLMGSLQYDKWLPGPELKFTAGYRHSLFQSYFMNASREVGLQSFQVLTPSIGLETRYDGPFNVVFSGSQQLMQTRLDDRWATSWARPLVLRAIYTPKKSLKINAECQHISWKRGGGTTAALLADVRLQWLPATVPKWRFEVFGENLCDVRAIRFLNVGTFSRSEQQTYLQPRHIGFSAERSF